MDEVRSLPVLPLLVAGAVFLGSAAAASAWLLRVGRSPRAVRMASRLLLAGCLAGIAALTLTRRGLDGGGANIIPGIGIVRQVNNVNRAAAVANLLGNVVMFMPVGFLAVTGFGLRMLRAVTAAAALSTVIEISQLALGRNFDIDDVLLNTAGALAGAALGRALINRSATSRA